MGIGSISNRQASQISLLIQQLEQASDQPSASPVSSGGPSTQTTLSSLAQAFGQLQRLQQTDPAEFKEVAAQVSTELRSQVGQASGHQAQFLGKLAAAFQQAARTGDMPQIASAANVGGTTRYPSPGDYAASSSQFGPAHLATLVQNTISQVISAQQSGSGAPG
jgi:hypothetical protein